MSKNKINSDAEKFLEKYVIKHGISKEEAQTHLLVKDVINYYKEIASNRGDNN